MKKIVFSGGGSAGHVIPNIALIEQLKHEFSIAYVGTDGIEEKICKANGVEFYKFDAVKFVRGKILCNLAIPFKLIKSIKQAGELLDIIKPDLVFCKGGYVCIPPAFAARKRHIPILTHESDISAGLANKIIAGKCEKVLTTFPSTAERFKNGVYTGSPMRSDIFGRDKKAAREILGLDNRPTLIVFGGGSGSKIINKNLRAAAFEICKRFNIIHICGRGNSVESNIFGYKQIEFADDMGLIYSCADCAVARCGSNSANELIALKIPTLFIPLENSSSRGDQVKNAEYFCSKGVCRV
ncbi:MAG: UDP-N-acetylglucosamine--N-acetylmuramyl-(pentapeptide) pyrophosphoryl-undecaprenol N-acetylglucosamine transferase, partial [Clostridia bacterium]|nr:UDP-N-acetylglucosamine--N-acetylmuramyl-(pentapeptide) pyrophosphoryl-undecaprenol N-acetylglucosamine transferase [Clostridia bacterium]